MGEPAPIRIRLPLPPSTNALYRTARVASGKGTGTRRVSSNEARAFRRTALPILDLIDGAPEHVESLALGRRGYWSVSLAAYFLTPHRRDLDDVLKLAIDVIAEGLRLADNRLVDLHASKYLAPTDPHLEVEIEVFPDWSFGDERAVLYPKPPVDG